MMRGSAPAYIHMNVTTINITTESMTALQGVVHTTFSSYFEPFLWLLFGALIIILGQYIQNYLLHIAGGIWFVAVGLTGMENVTSFTFPYLIFFVLVGFGVIWHAIQQLAALKDRNNRRTVRDND